MRLLAIVILLYWAGMTFTLVKDRILPSWSEHNLIEVQSDSLVDEWEDIEEIDKIIYNGQRLGSSALQVKRNKDRGTFDVVHNMDFDLKLFGAKRKIKWQSRLFLEPDFSVDRFKAVINVDLKTGLTSQPLEWEITGFTLPDKLYFKIKRFGSEQYGSFPTQGKLSLFNTIAPTLFKKEQLKTGKVYSIPVFDPLWQMDRGKMIIRVAAREKIKYGMIDNVEVYRVETRMQTEFGEMESRFWVNDYGVVVRREFMDRLIMERMTFKSEKIERESKRRFFRKINIPEMSVKEYQEGAERDAIDQASGIADLLKGNYGLE